MSVKTQRALREEPHYLCGECGTVAPTDRFWHLTWDQSPGSDTMDPPAYVHVEHAPESWDCSDPTIVCLTCAWAHSDGDYSGALWMGTRWEMEQERERVGAENGGALFERWRGVMIDLREGGFPKVTYAALERAVRLPPFEPVPPSAAAERLSEPQPDLAGAVEDAKGSPGLGLVPTPFADAAIHAVKTCIDREEAEQDVPKAVFDAVIALSQFMTKSRQDPEKVYIDSTVVMRGLAEPSKPPQG